MIEQITYLLFIKRLADRQENEANRLGIPMRRIFPEGEDDLRWSRLKGLGSPSKMFEIIGQRVFPFLRTLGGTGRRTRST